MKKAHIIVLVYVLVILASAVYFGMMQHFGFKGMGFCVGGRDRIFSALDILIVTVFAASLFLLLLSLVAFRRTNDNRMLIVSLAFFFFSANSFLSVLENFFPDEFIFIDHASQVLNMLVLVSFIMLMYAGFKRSENIKKRKQRKR